jgi:hypothetical protein
MTRTETRALEVLRSEPTGMCARDFARRMWPDSPSWRRLGRCGPNGSAYGIGIQQRAGAYLAAMERAGLVVAVHRPGRGALYRSR